MQRYRFSKQRRLFIAHAAAALTGSVLLAGPGGVLAQQKRKYGITGELAPELSLSYWIDKNGDEVLRSIYLTRVTHAKREKVTGADMLRELGEPIVDRPLSATARQQLSDYFRIKEANRKAGQMSAEYANYLKFIGQP